MIVYEIRPEPIKTGTYKPSVNINTLSPDQKREVWEHLKEHHPEIALQVTELMKDQGVKKLMAEFDGGLLVEKKYLPQTFTYKYL